jgi:hypothetical protein
MAFATTNLVQVSTSFDATSPAIFSLITADDAAACEASNYLNAAADRVKAGDMILGYVDTGGTAEFHVYGVASNDGTTVVLADVFAAHA